MPADANEVVWPTPRERLTPYTLSLATLMLAYIPSEDPVVQACLEESSCSILGSHVYQDLAVFFLTQIRGAAARSTSLETEPSLVDLVTLVERALSGTPGAGEAFGAFLVARLKRIESPDDLVDLLASFEPLTLPLDSGESVDEFSGRPTLVDRRSLFGIFLRRIILAHGAMLFDGVAQLFRDMKTFYEDFSRSTRAAAARHPVATSNLHEAYMSPRELQQVLRARAVEVERGINLKTFEETEREIQALLDVVPTLPQAFFLRYLNCLFHNEYQGAVDNLHRYFDYSLRGLETMANQEDSSDPTTASTAVRGKRRRAVEQYLSLNLAALHFHFGRLQESLLAVEETMRVGQQNGDHYCVTLALSWLYKIKVKQNHSTAPKLLQRCLDRATQLNMHELKHLMRLEEADFQAKHPTAYRPRTVDGDVDAKDGSMVHFSSGPAVLTRDMFDDSGPPGGAIADIHGPDAVSGMNAGVVRRQRSDQSLQQSLQGRAHMLKSSLWDVLGDETMSMLGLQVALSCHSAETTSSYDTLLALVKLAHGQIHSSTFPKQGLYSHVHALGLQTLIDARKRFPLLPGKLWPHATASLLVDAALNRCEIARAHALCHQLAGLTVLSDGDDTMYIDTRMKWAKYLLLIGNAEESFRVYVALVDFCNARSLHSHEAHVLLAMVHLMSKSASATGNIPYALPLLMRCLAMAEKYKLGMVEADATVCLANAHLEMGNARRAKDILRRVMSRVMGSGSPKLQARLNLCFAKCLFGVASVGQSNSTSDAAETSLLNSAPGNDSFQSIADESLQCLLRSVSGFEAVQDYAGMRESLYLLARLYNELPGREHDRDKTAQLFIDVDTKIEEARGKTITSLHGLHSWDGLSSMVSELSSV